MKPKYYKEVNAPDNTLVCRYGKCNGEDDIVSAHGKGCSRADGALVLNMLTRQRCEPDFPSINKYHYEPSYLDELDKRGYDIKTLRFTISKKMTKEMDK